MRLSEHWRLWEKRGTRSGALDQSSGTWCESDADLYKSGGAWYESGGGLYKSD